MNSARLNKLSERSWGPASKAPLGGCRRLVLISRPATCLQFNGNSQVLQYVAEDIASNYLGGQMGHTHIVQYEDVSRDLGIWGGAWPGPCPACLELWNLRPCILLSSCH